MPSQFKTIRILGIDFYNDSLARALEEAHHTGGLFLAPSGPGLSELGHNRHYDRALQEADVNLIDSGYLALLWKKRSGQSLQRHSGLKFIKALIEDPIFNKPSKQLWVMPTPSQTQATSEYLQQQGIALESSHFYLAPYYTKHPVTDSALLEKIQQDRPDYVILAIAGGKQEVLGHWLREQLDYKPAIICIGAAIAFLSGQQANIPSWADRVYIGWFLRILKDPKTFFPRYWKARKLKQILQTYGESAPPLL
ncbi:WecB/TagA/CpsF family glycosyltransferase [Coraliomargarita sp. W4R53]